MRAFRLCLGVACFLVVVISLQPFREVPRGRAGLQALAAPARATDQLGPSAPGEAVLVGGVLAAASDARRERPVEVLPGPGLGARRPEYVLAPGTRLDHEGGTVVLEGARFELAGTPTEYPYGSAVVAYGAVDDGGMVVWALARDAASLEVLARQQTALLGWPWLLVGLALAAVGYGFALAGAYAVRGTLGRARRASPHLAGLALAGYLIVGFGLLGSAWAMLWPMVGGVSLTAIAAIVLALRYDRKPVDPRRRARP
jgi:hypothetical protein